MNEPAPEPEPQRLARALSCPGLASNGRYGFATGSTIVNSVPAPGLEVNETSPPR